MGMTSVRLIKHEAVPKCGKLLAIARRVLLRQAFEYCADAIFEAIDAPAIVSDGTVTAALGRYFFDLCGRECASEHVIQVRIFRWVSVEVSASPSRASLLRDLILFGNCAK